MSMKRFVLLSAILCLAALTTARAETVSRIAAAVRGQRRHHHHI